MYSANVLFKQLHAAIVEIFVEEGGYCRYTTIQNWSDNVYNLVTKRAKAAAQRNCRVDRWKPWGEDNDEISICLLRRTIREGDNVIQSHLPEKANTKILVRR